MGIFQDDVRSGSAGLPRARPLFNHVDYGTSRVTEDDSEDGSSDNGEGPSSRPPDLPNNTIITDAATQTASGDDDSEAAQPVASSRASSNIDLILSEGKLRDSLDLGKYRRIPRRSSSLISPHSGGDGHLLDPERPGFGTGDRWKAAMTMPVGIFSIPTTMAFPHRERSSDALNCVQPYPNPSAFRNRTPKLVSVGPRRQQPHKGRSVSVSHMADGSVMVTSNQLNQNNNQGASGDCNPVKQTRRMSRVVARIKRRRTESAPAGPEQAGGFTAKDKGKGKAVDFVDPVPDPVMPGCSRDHEGTEQPALYMVNSTAAEPKIDAPQASSKGERGFCPLSAAGRKIRSFFGRLWKAPVPVKEG